ncbi:MAG: tetratricopeptide repeat protein [Rhodospirillales bacterium]|nr:tetratricopeptide repeat protein [Alphaproteobacteria bacterium]MBL6948556.1 tetratricopeptide repeat protein [Rhodospirillales bacterium]
MRTSLALLSNLFFAAVLTGTAAKELAAKEIDHPTQYYACMALAKSSPQEAFDTALNWRDLGGGDAADHCVAAALIGLRQYVEAAGRLEKLAERAKQKPGVRAGLLAHAAQAWILAENPNRAEAVLTAALKLSPDDGNLLIDRAQARGGQKNFTGAVEDLSRAITLEDRRADAFVFRASAYRMLDKLELALADIERALALQPSHPDGLLERGNLRRLRQDDDGARRDWLNVIRNDPGGAAADAARRNLESMDVKTGR